MDDFFAAIEVGNASAVRAFLERDSSLANAVKVVTSSPMPNQEEAVVRCRSGLPHRSQSSAEARPPLTNTALQIAVKRNHLDIVRLLIEFGADVNAATERQSAPPLLLAMQHSRELNLDLVRVLVEAGADVNARDKLGNTPLNSAFRWCQDVLPVVELLLAHGAEINGCTKQRRTPLDKAVIFLASPAIDHVRMIETLLRFGAHTNPARPDDEEDPDPPPLNMVVRSGNVRVARMLIEAGADVNAADRWGAPLHCAAEKGFDQIVELLLDAGADPSVRDAKGHTPIELVESMEELANHFERLLEQR